MVSRSAMSFFENRGSHSWFNECNLPCMGNLHKSRQKTAELRDLPVTKTLKSSRGIEAESMTVPTRSMTGSCTASQAARKP